MSKVVPVSITKATIFPINSQNEYTYLKGNPIINFQIAPQNGQRLIDTSTLRLNFKVKFYNGADPTKYVNNDNAYNHGGAYTAQVNSRVGNSSVIDLVRLRNFKNEIIEEIRHYPRSLATILPLTNSMEYYKNVLTSKMGASGYQRMQNLMTNSCRSMSLPLRCGLFLNETELNLAQIGGMKIDIQLSSDSMLFSTQPLSGGAAAADRAYYGISDVSLSWNYINMSSPVPNASQPIPYPAYNSFTQIINSSNDQKSLNLNLQSVNSVFQNFILSSRINNWSFDSFETPKLKNSDDNEKAFRNVMEVANMRNAQLYPLKYPINQRIQVANDAFEAHLMRNFLNSVRSYNKVDSTTLSSYTQQEYGFANYNGGVGVADNASTFDANKGDYKLIYGIGTKYDSLNNSNGAEFKQSFYQLRLESDLNGTSPNTTYLFSLSNQQLLANNSSVRPIM